MFTINHNSYQNNRRESDHTEYIPHVADSDATQRVNLGNNSNPYPPQRRSSSNTAGKHQPSRTTGSANRKNSGNNRKETVIIFVLLGIAAILLIGVVFAASILLRKPADDGLIPNNVFAAGVNLGGMTEEQAAQALHEATKDTYAKLDMTVQVLDTTVILSPKDTGARLNVDAVVAAALASNNSSTISILPYLNLNTTYIHNVVDELGRQYSSTLTQGTVTVEGTKPTDPQSSTDTVTAFQTLVIYVGTAEYGLSTDSLYEQIMDAYDMNLFQVVGQCSVIAPDPLNLDSFYQSICSAPVDASLDTTTYEVTKEVYGYGFDLTKANEMIAAAKYGDTVRVPIRFIQPDITEEMLTADLFRDVLAEFSTKIDSKNTNLMVNLKLACKAINDLLIKSGESFSFSQATGQPSIGKGYQDVEIYQGTTLNKVIGGGISQVATTLYNCALLADLDIVERHAHTYAPSYVAPGLDAMISWGSADLIFTNNTDYPIRIEVEIIEKGKANNKEDDKDNNTDDTQSENNEVSESENTEDLVVVRFIGTNNNDYYVDIETEVVEHKPTTLHQAMVEGNTGGYVKGDILVEGIVGYDVIVYRNLIEKETDRQLNRSVKTYDRYEKRNEVVVSIYTPPVEEPDAPTEPTGTEPSTESNTVPSTPSATKPKSE